MPDSPGLFTMAATGLSLSATILATQAANLKGYWKCDEPSGTTLADSSGNGNDLGTNGTINTNYWLGEAGDNGTCFRTDGAVGYAAIGSSIIGNSLQAVNWTFFALFKGGTDFGGGTGLCISSFAIFNERIHIGSNAGTAQAQGAAVDSATTVPIVQAGTAFDNAWHSLAWRRNGTAFTLFVDGISVGSDTQSLAVGTNLNVTSLMVLAYNNTANFCKGSAQHAAIWNTNLSDAEIAAIDAAR